MNKTSLIEFVIEFLTEELKAQDPASPQIERLQTQLQVLKFLPRTQYTAEDWIIPSSLVCLQVPPQGPEFFCLILPSTGGLVLGFEGRPVQIISAQSPLGEALVGRKEGDLIEVPQGQETKSFRIVKNQ